MNLFEYPVEYILQFLGGFPCRLKWIASGTFPRASLIALSALSCTSLGSLGTWNFPFTRFTDLGFRSDLTGIGDVSVGASVLGLYA